MTLTALPRWQTSPVRAQPQTPTRVTPALLTPPPPGRVERNGFYGGLRLLWSAVVQFYSYHASHGRTVPSTPGFNLSYATNIPKQAGLSGSSAIVTATVSCLEALYGPQCVIPHAERPNVVLSAETALGITAGLQDRVIQTYGGCMMMDFDAEYMRSHNNCGRYHRLPVAQLPRLWLVWGDNPGDSGTVHANIRARYDAGEPAVVQAMTAVAQLPLEGQEALLQGDTSKLAQLMTANFQLRRRMFGDAALGAFNVHMVQVASACGAGAKFTGSGGAVVALCPLGEAQEAQLQRDCAQAGLSFQLVTVHVPDPLPEAA